MHLTNFISCYQNPVDSIYQSNDTLFSLPAYSYQWYETNNGIIAAATNQYFVPLTSGNYYCLVSDSIGCNAPSNVISVITDLLEPATTKGGLTITPNPNNGTFEIKLKDVNLKGDFECTIYDATGRIIFNSKSNPDGYRDKNLKLNLADGIYFLNVKTVERNYFAKFAVNQF